MKTKKACIWILMTALMVSLLAGCGGKAEPDENSGLYKAVFAYEGDEYKMKRRMQ